MSTTRVGKTQEAERHRDVCFFRSSLMSVIAGVTLPPGLPGLLYIVGLREDISSWKIFATVMTIFFTSMAFIEYRHLRLAQEQLRQLKRPQTRRF